jgi:stress response protein YsnF
MEAVMKTVVGMFSNVGEAQRSFEDLTSMGFSPNDISVVTRSSEKAASERMRLSMIDAPDAGKVAASGPIGAALAQRQAGLVGTLRNAGVSSTLAEHYATAVRQGETLESLIVDDRDAERVAAVMKRHAARSGTGDQLIESQRAMAEKTARAEQERMRGTTTEGEDTYIPVMREELQVGKREVERGGVHVDVRAVERPVSEHIRLRDERIDIERRPADRAPRPDEPMFTAGQLDMTERSEEAVISKQVRVVEEIHLHKVVTEREEVVSEKLRSTDVQIDELAGERKAYREHFDKLGSGGNFEEVLPAYELGRSMRTSPSQRWEEIETSARQRWEAKRPGTWEKYKDGIRYAWARARAR